MNTNLIFHIFPSFFCLLLNSNVNILAITKWRESNMGLRENFQKLIDKKQQEIRGLELQLREAGAYIQGLQDSMKLLPRDGAAEKTEHTLRPDSTLSRTRDILKASRVPMPINEILKALGLPVDTKNRVSLAGTLSGYAKKKRIFTKTAPNTFGLLEFESTEEEDELPEEFGSMTQ
jgi:hypothetical protein